MTWLESLQAVDHAALLCSLNTPGLLSSRFCLTMRISLVCVICREGASLTKSRLGVKILVAFFQETFKSVSREAYLDLKIITHLENDVSDAR